MLVGSEAHHKAYRNAAAGEPVTVELVAEVGNPHNRHAVAGYLRGDQLAGYLGKGSAAEYQPLIERANALGYRVRVSGAFVRPGAGPLSVAVGMPSPDDFSSWLDLPPDARALGFRG